MMNIERMHMKILQDDLDQDTSLCCRMFIGAKLLYYCFQRKVWDHLRAIPEGQTVHYSEIASAIGRPKAARAVARACASNPVAIIIPCHRVVPKAGDYKLVFVGKTKKLEKYIGVK